MCRFVAYFIDTAHGFQSFWQLQEQITFLIEHGHIIELACLDRRRSHLFLKKKTKTTWIYVRAHFIRVEGRDEESRFLIASERMSMSLGFLQSMNSFSYWSSYIYHHIVLVISSETSAYIQLLDINEQYLKTLSYQTPQFGTDFDNIIKCNIVINNESILK